MENKFEFNEGNVTYLKNESTPDCYKFDGDLEKLIEIAENIFKKIEPESQHDSIRNDLLESGGEVRFFEGGIFAIFLSGSKGGKKLFIQNRNARGDNQYQEKLKNLLMDYI